MSNFQHNKMKRKFSEISESDDEEIYSDNESNDSDSDTSDSNSEEDDNIIDGKIINYMLLTIIFAIIYNLVIM